MKAPFGVLFPALALGLALVAIAVGANYAVAVPAGAAAVVFAGLTLWDAVRRSDPSGRRAAARGHPPPVGARGWFLHGGVGREELVLLVDRLDRAGDHPDLPVRTPAEVERILRLSDREFRAYVNARLDAIEGIA